MNFISGAAMPAGTWKLPAEFDEPNWYTLQSSSSQQILEERGIETVPQFSGLDGYGATRSFVGAPPYIPGGVCTHVQGEAGYQTWDTYWSKLLQAIDDQPASQTYRLEGNIVRWVFTYRGSVCAWLEFDASMGNRGGYIRGCVDTRRGALRGLGAGRVRGHMVDRGGGNRAAFGPGADFERANPWGGYGGLGRAVSCTQTWDGGVICDDTPARHQRRRTTMLGYGAGMYATPRLPWAQFAGEVLVP